MADAQPAILGIGTFCTHTVVHGAAGDPDRRTTCRRRRCRLIGCGVMTGVGAALYHGGRASRARSVAVFGCGGVGDSVIAGRAAGRARRRSSRWTSTRASWSGRRSSARPTRSTPRDGDPVAAIKELTGGHGVNYSFEAVGRPETLEQAIFCRDLRRHLHLHRRPRPRREPRRSSCSAFFDIGGYLRRLAGTATACRRATSRCWPTGTARASSIWTRWSRRDHHAGGGARTPSTAMERGETLRSVIVF
ncbi:MAG: hypothetical protein V9E83_05440 [Baekduia sp.]